VVTDITDAKEAQDSANANASALTSLTSRVTNVEGQVTSQASQLSSLTSQVNDASSKVDQMAQTITNNEKTQSSLNTSLQSQIDAQASANIKNQTELNNATTSLAAIKSTQQTQATTISALSQQQTNLTAQVGGQSAELQELKKTVVENGNVNSTWMVKMETNSNGKKYAAGIALGIDGKNLQSQFLVQADRFGLINTSNGNTTTPFVVENGVAYMNAAVIKDGSITNAKIGSEIRSDNFVDGSRGWRVGKDGSSQFHNVIVRGHVEAESGSFKGTIDATDGVFRGTVQASRFVGDICSAGVFKQGVRPDITHYDSGSVGGTKTYVVSGTVACDVNFVGKIMVWIKGVKVSEFSVGAAASNATTRYIPAVGSLSGVTDQNVRCEITVEGSGIYNYVGGFALMTRSSGSWA
ncbi:phage tail tip fiber protein, partial [Klebsiella pneumoniae]